ncbi:hypothetical protein [Jonesia quinghaiensis]|uniref:hypothetical protein n=1 Tax=Jonesia quinghaiensis TaxID=262806 RepID=UPI00041B487D|nr:hypothetical protein [Jonesia quinghaiensis]
MNSFLIGLGALIPSLGVGALFYFAMRFIVRADRNERAQLAELDRIAEEEQRNDEANAAH